MTEKLKAPLPRFVVLEGGDGTGRTTQLQAVDRALTKAGVAHWTTSEPTDRPEGLLIRRILSGELRRDPGTLARLFAADRNEHLREADGILARLARGETVVCDRYVLSSLAYQGVDCGPELPLLLNSDFPFPELLFFFDLPPAQSVTRLERREKLDIFEDLPFQERVGEGYRRVLASYGVPGMKIVRVDASRPVSEVSRTIFGALSATLGILLPSDVE